MTKAIITFIKYSPIIILPCIIALAFYFITSNHKAILKTSFQTYEENLIQSNKDAVKKNVRIAIQLFENQELLTNNKDRANRAFLHLLKQINNKVGDYYFIFNTNGDTIIHPFLSSLEGENLVILNDDNYNAILKHLTTNYEEDRFITYNWLNPSTNLLEEKISFVKLIPNTNFILGSGFYLNDIRKAIQFQKELEENEFHKSLSTLLTLFVIFIFISFVISSILSTLLTKEFKKLNQSFNQESQETKEEVEIKQTKLDKTTKQIDDLAMIDDLTKSYNRFFFFDSLEKHLNELETLQKIFSLIALDIDNFKAVNENFGHDLADELLIEIVDLMKHFTKKENIVARIDGEEFIILLQNTPLNSAFRIAQEIRKEIENKIFFDKIKITVSLGVAEANNPTSIKDLMKKVGAALYKAQKEGQNRVFAFKN